VLGAGNAALGEGVAGVEVGPVCGDVESSGFSSDQGLFVGLGCGQSACRVQLAETIFEHAFNVRLGTDIPHRLDTAAPTDNT
jgi:hypothetical protein